MKPTEKNYKNARREREANGVFNVTHTRPEREPERFAPNRADYRRAWRASGESGRVRPKPLPFDWDAFKNK